MGRVGSVCDRECEEDTCRHDIINVTRQPISVFEIERWISCLGEHSLRDEVVVGDDICSGIVECTLRLVVLEGFLVKGCSA